MSRREEQARPEDRRRHHRIIPRLAMTCDVQAPGEAAEVGDVQDFSAGGLAFLCARGWKAGEVLRIRLLSPAGTFQLDVGLRVTRSARMRGGGWLVAGAFVQPLSPREAGPFLIG